MITYNGGSFSDTPSKIVDGGTFSDIPTIIIDGGNFLVYDISKDGIFYSYETGVYTITCTDPNTGISTSTTVNVVDDVLNIYPKTESEILSLSSFGNYNFDVDGTKYGFIQLYYNNYQATDTVTLEYSKDQQTWNSISITSFTNNGYCRINTLNDYSFRIKVYQNGTISYSEILNTTTFYKTPVLTGTKWYFINKNLHIRTQIEDNSVEDSIKFEYSTNQISWTELNSTHLGWNVYQTDFDEVGKSGIYYTRSKIVRPANTFYSDVDSIDLDNLSPKNIIGYNPTAPKTPTLYKDAKIGFRVGSVKLGQTYEEPKSILKLGLQKLGVNTLGTYVSIDIKLNTQVSLTRYWSSSISSNVIYDLIQYYSNLTPLEVQYDLVHAEKIINLLAQINPEIKIEAHQLSNVKIRCTNRPKVTLESIINKEVELDSSMNFEVEIESNL